MSIRIVLPDGSGLMFGSGTKIYTESGEEITGVMSCEIMIDSDSFITALLRVPVSDIENFSSAPGVVIQEPDE